MADQLIIVPQISSYPGHEARAQAIVRWLARLGVVEAMPSTCGRTGNRMAFALASGARLIARHPDRLPFDEPVNGLEVITRRCIYTPTLDFKEEAGCPECRREIGEALFDSLEEWMPGHTDHFRCPECGHEDDINGFLFLQPCAFSNLGFIFNNWGSAGFNQAFLDAFSERLGYAVTQVSVACQ